MNPLETLWIGALVIFLLITGKLQRVIERWKKPKEEKPAEDDGKPKPEGDIPDNPPVA